MAESGTKLVPFTVNSISGPPINADVGEMLEIIGPPTTRIQNGTVLESVSLSGWRTRTDTITEFIRRGEGIVAVNWVAETNVVSTGESNQITDPSTKFVPFTVISRSSLSTSAESGVMLVIVGTGPGSWLSLTENDNAARELFIKADIESIFPNMETCVTVATTYVEVATKRIAARKNFRKLSCPPAFFIK